MKRTRSAGSGPRRARWPWLSLLPLGLGAWAPIAGGIGRRIWWWVALGVLWTAVTLSGYVVTTSHRAGHGALGGWLVLIGWGGSICTSFALRRRDERRAGRPARPRLPWPQPTERSRSWSPRYALGAYVATFAAVVVLGLLLGHVVHVHVQLGLGGLIVDALLLIALVPLIRRGLSGADLGLRPTVGARSVGLVVLALVAYVAVAAIWVAALHLHSPANALLGTRNPSSVNAVLDVIALSASAPIVEEIFFRGLLYRSIRNRLPVAPAAIIAGCLFGLVHITGYPLNTLPVKAAFGIIACLLYERTGSLLPGIALHSFVDASAIDLALTGNDTIVLGTSAVLAIVVLVAARIEGLIRVDRAAADADHTDDREPAPTGDYG